MVVIAALYAPQPLYNVLSAEYGLGRTVISLAVTCIMLPLAVAPVLYGLLLESLPAGRVARAAVLVLAAGHFCLAAAPPWWGFLILRFVQGLAVPAALTSLMTILSRSCGPDRVQRVLSLYITATIVGGFSGRFFSGVISAFFGWRAAFVVLGASSVAVWGLLTRLRGAPPSSFTRPCAALVAEVLRRRGMLRAYAVPFCAFFAFTAILNYLPFRLAELEGGAGELRVSLMYSSYLVGVLTSLNSTRIVRRLGSEPRAIRWGLVLFTGTVAACLLPNGWALFATLFPFCCGFFLVQSVGPGLVNHLGDAHKGLVNGLYISFYYAGGVVGSFIPGLIYAALGWNGLVSALLVVLGIGIWAAQGLSAGPAPREDVPPAPGPAA
ncbi:MAG: MFS transporter [Desulfovibrionaceae bacterium]